MNIAREHLKKPIPISSSLIQYSPNLLDFSFHLIVLPVLFTYEGRRTNNEFEEAIEDDSHINFSQKWAIKYTSTSVCKLNWNLDNRLVLYFCLIYTVSWFIFYFFMQRGRQIERESDERLIGIYFVINDACANIIF